MEKRFNINLEQLSVGYKLGGGKALEILKGINLTATAGEMVALIGSNGIGKSTLLRTIAGFQEYFSGNIKINREDISSLSARELSQIMSFVSTENIRVANMTVFDLVAYGRFPYTNWLGKLTADDKHIVMEAIEKVGLVDFKDRMITQISDGERQRAMIARAVAQDTPVIVLDEPTAFLDVSNKYEIFHLLQILTDEKGKTILLSTHDLNIALREADKLWILTGDENYQGSPEDAVLMGWLDKLFINEHIGFDTREGEFFFRKEFKAKVRVEGEGLRMLWTLRALNRSGYQIVVEAKPDFRIMVHDKSWELSSKDTIQQFDTIYQLLAYLD